MGTFSLVFEQKNEWNWWEYWQCQATHQQHNISIILIRPLRVHCCGRNVDVAKFSVEKSQQWWLFCLFLNLYSPSLDGHILPCIDPWKHAMLHINNTNMSLADPSLLSKMRCDKWLLRKVNFGAFFHGNF